MEGRGGRWSGDSFIRPASQPRRYDLMQVSLLLVPRHRPGTGHIHTYPFLRVRNTAKCRCLVSGDALGLELGKGQGAIDSPADRIAFSYILGATPFGIDLIVFWIWLAMCCSLMCQRQSLGFGAVVCIPRRTSTPPRPPLLSTLPPRSSLTGVDVTPTTRRHDTPQQSNVVQVSTAYRASRTTAIRDPTPRSRP